MAPSNGQTHQGIRVETVADFNSQELRARVATGRRRRDTRYRDQVLDTYGAKWRTAALSATGIRQLAPGGKARAFGDIVANELAELENRQFLNIAQSLLPFATDTSLDLIGEIFGVARLTQQTASVDMGDQNFEWFVRNGTFGSINSGQDIVIPSFMPPRGERAGVYRGGSDAAGGGQFHAL
jgi:hypothetical protein